MACFILLSIEQPHHKSNHGSVSHACFISLMVRELEISTQ
jgi:hypothetical protein